MVNVAMEAGSMGRQRRQAELTGRVWGERAIVTEPCCLERGTLRWRLVAWVVSSEIAKSKRNENCKSEDFEFPSCNHSENIGTSLGWDRETAGSARSA